MFHPVEIESSDFDPGSEFYIVGALQIERVSKHSTLSMSFFRAGSAPAFASA